MSRSCWNLSRKMYLINVDTVLALICVLISRIESIYDNEEPAGNVTELSLDLSPQQVSVDAIAEHSFTLSWQPPFLSANQSSDLVAYSLTYNVHQKEDTEKILLLPPNTSTKLVRELSEGTEYRVVLSSVYDTKLRVPAPELYVTTLFPVVEMAPGDDFYPDRKFECNCSETGMLACTRTSQNVECTCYPGYYGKWCDVCSQGYFRAGEKCERCPCNNITSSGECVLVEEEVTCTSCQPGHSGIHCADCIKGYKWKEGRCIPTDPLCDTCSDSIALSTTVLRHKSANISLNDGTIPIIAVIVTLTVLLLVAASASCYRYWSHRQTRLRLPFWSIELREDKMNLSSGCHYQQLDAATSRVVQAQCDDVDVENSPCAYRPLNA